LSLEGFGNLQVQVVLSLIGEESLVGFRDLGCGTAYGVIGGCTRVGRSHKSGTSQKQEVVGIALDEGKMAKVAATLI
jgi:hypothetical protein